MDTDKTENAKSNDEDETDVEDLELADATADEVKGGSLKPPANCSPAVQFTAS
jgi:hypothetical protein